MGVITKLTSAERGRERSSFVMPLAAMVPLGIITVALGLAGLGMGGVHYAFTGEVRDSSIAPARFAPIREQPCATQHTACTGGGDPLLAPPSSRAPASYRCTRCRPPLPPQRAISKSLHTPSHPPTLRCTPALEVGQARVRAAAGEETAEVKAGSAARAVAGLEAVAP